MTMGEMYMPDSPNGGYRPLPKREFIVELADDGDRTLFVARNDDVREAIVRCKDCRRMVPIWDPVKGEKTGHFGCNIGGQAVHSDDFCAWGVAKDGA